MALLRAASPSDLGPVIESESVMLRTPQTSDYPAWAELRAVSRDFLTPWEPLWATDELSRASFRRRIRHYLRDLREDVGYALFIFAAATGSLVGGLTLCNVRRGVTQSCTLGYRPRRHPFRVRFARVAPAGSGMPADQYGLDQASGEDRVQARGFRAPLFADQRRLARPPALRAA